MERNTKYKPDHLCIAIFTLCLSVRFVEYFLIETDQTAIGENVLHKVVGIIILALVLKRVNLSWRDIGFQRNGFAGGILKGLLLGSACFTISYGLEFAILALQGNPAHLEIYISSFSLTGSQIKNTDFVFFLLCVLFNIINVWMEEGIFRGLFIRTLSETKPFMQANFIAAILFGIWHIVMPIRSYIHGEMSFAAMVLMGIGYMILSGIMGIKWGLLYRITGNIWAGLGDHLFNNTVAANMLHVISAKGTDELQIVRIMAAQIISFVFVLMIARTENEIKKIENFIDKQKVSFICSIDDENCPNVKAMLKPCKRIGLKEFYFSTNTSSMRVKQYKDNSSASIYFYHKGLMKYVGVMLKGKMEVLTDQETKNMMWKKGDTMFYKKGVTDPDYCVLKFTATSGRYYCDLKTENFDIK